MAVLAPPPDTVYEDLTPGQLAFIQATVPLAARGLGLHATITSTPMDGGKLRAVIQFGGAPAPAAAAPVAVPAAQAVPAAHAVAVAVRTPLRAGGDIDFKAGGRPLAQADFDAALSELGGIEADLLWALLHQEGGTPPVGYLSDRRPQILFERHHFSRLTDHKYDASHPDISGPAYTVYGTRPQQYDRLTVAMTLDEDAALQACSWGIAQVLAESATDLGYGTARAMVQEMIASEGAQLDACVRFVRKAGAASALASKNWQGFAEKYNGPGNVVKYGASLEGHYDDMRNARDKVDLQVRAVQLELTYLNHSMAVDGVAGGHTADAVRAFQSLAGLTPANGVLDAATLSAIEKAAFPGV
jgi:hypothetical protein